MYAYILQTLHTCLKYLWLYQGDQQCKIRKFLISNFLILEISHLPAVFGLPTFPIKMEHLAEKYGLDYSNIAGTKLNLLMVPSLGVFRRKTQHSIRMP